MSTRAISSLTHRARYSRGNRTRFVPVPSEYDANSENITILNAALAAGMYPKILTLNASGLQTITNQQPVSIVCRLVDDIAFSLILKASQFDQFQDFKSGLRLKLSGLLYHHAVQEAVCLGDGTCR